MRRRRGEVSGGDGLRRILGQVRRRWRMRRVIRGSAFVALAAIVAVLGTTWGLEATRFSAGAVTTFRLVAWGGVALLTGLLVLRPLFRRVSDEQIALYLEEHEPTLEAAIMGAVAADDSRQSAPESAALLDQLVARAVRKARTVDEGRRIDQPGLQRASGALAAVTTVAILLLLFGPSDVRRGASALLPTSDVAAINPYSIALEPGDITVARGSDQLVTARLVGFGAENVTLFTRSGDSEQLQRLSMIPTMEDGAFDVLLLGLAEELEYFVESDGIRSPSYQIEVVDLPYVDRMDHVYHFPGYTGLDDRTLEDAGDVAALRGTRVELSIEPTIPTPAGRLLIDGEVAQELSIDAEGRLSGEIEVRTRGYYQIELALPDGRFIAGSPEYRIDLLSDQPPSITITKPGRDANVSPLEETYFEVEADDDYGIGSMSLVYSVNGEPEDTVQLFRGGRSPLTDVSAGHTLYIEDFDVEPGDLITYYAFASDERAGTPQEVVSDIYFLQVQPFGRDFREAPQQPGGQQGGGEQQNSPELSELQRQVTAATFNLKRDREDYTEEEFSESSIAVSLAQGRVKTQVETLVQRMTNRQVTQDDQFQEIAEMLPEALEAMDSSAVALQRADPDEALAPQQQALRVLLRAEETYERYVSLEQNQGGGGGGQRPNAEDLADLFELELDRLQNQYETVERGERQEQNEQVDELLQKLEELARRQQQEAERQAARAQQQQQQGGGGGGGAAQSQRELADEAEETARELQRLSRETGDQELAETARELQRAADAMRRSAANGGNTGLAEAERALDRIEEASRRLQQDREERLEEDAESALERAQDLLGRQGEVREQLEDLPEDLRERIDGIRDLQGQKTEMASELEDLERTLDRLASDARQRDPEAARAFTEAADEIRDTNVAREIAWSRGLIESPGQEAYARIFEREIEVDLERVERAISNAATAARDLAEQEGTREALEQAQDLVRGMESLDRRLEARTEEAAEGERRGLRPGAQSGENAEGQPGEQGDGQQGEQGEGQQQGEGQGQQQGQGQQGEGQGGQQGQRGGEGQRESGQPGQEGAGGGGAPQGGTFNDGTGGGGVRGNPRAFTEEEIRQFSREFAERLGEASGLRDLLRGEGQETGDLDQAIEAMRALRDVETYDDLPQVALLQETLRQSLGRLEFTLRRQVEGEDADRAALTGSQSVPDGFRRLVDEYYRALARGGGGGNR